MITLKTDDILGKGRFRVCYRHPENDNYIIKIQHNIRPKSTSAHERELDFYAKISGNLEFFPEYIGQVSTNHGEGLIFKKIQEKDGKKPLHIFKKYPDRKIPSHILSQIKTVMSQLERDALLTCAVNPENILITNSDHGDKIFCCDAKVLEIREFIPISKIRIIRSLKVKRRNNRLYRLYESKK